MNHPDTAALANAAFDATGLATHREFIAMTGDAIGMRTFRGWLAGETPATPIAKLVLRAIVSGWRPEQNEGGG